MKHKPVFLRTAFENGSPLLWDVNEESVTIQSLHDHERGSSNRQGSHWHFEIHGTAGQKLKMTFLPLVSIYGGKPGHFLKEGFTSVSSTDGKTWTPFRFQFHPDFSISTELELLAPVTRIALIQPYVLADFDHFLERVLLSPFTSTEIIAHTAEGRPVELITLSSGKAKRSVLIRARAHPWETAGNFFVEGLAERVLGNKAGQDFLNQFELHLIPMTNKDGVVRGYSRFTPLGADLNRNFRAGFDHAASGGPENAGLLAWLDRKKIEGRLPDLALDLHNDQEGNLHLSPDDGRGYLSRMKRFEACLLRHTPYREGSKSGPASGTFGDGLLSLYGIDAAILEFNAHWLEGMKCIPLAEHWRKYGADSADAFADYFSKL